MCQTNLREDSLTLLICRVVFDSRPHYIHLATAECEIPSYFLSVAHVQFVSKLYWRLATAISATFNIYFWSLIVGFEAYNQTRW